MEETKNDFRIYLSDKLIFIQIVSSNKLLLIERSPYKISNCKSLEFLAKIEITDSIKANAILGTYHINNHVFLVYAKTSLFVGALRYNKKIYEIKSTEFLQITQQSVDNETINIIENMKKMLTFGFFYSSDYDLTTILQKNQALNEESEFIPYYTRDYLWNENLLYDFIKNKIDNSFYVNMIYGYVGFYSYNLKDLDENIKIILISRKNVNNSGQFLYSSGLNEENYSSNCVETEQIIFMGDYYLSYVQIRGTCPIFYHCVFEKESEKIKVNLIKDFVENKTHFLENIKNLTSDEYSSLYFINALSKCDEGQSLLKENFETLIEINEVSDKCKFGDLELDLNEDPSNKIDHFINSIDDVINSSNFLIKNFDSDQIYQKQTSLIKTICFDSTIKTNLIQTKISLKILNKQLNEISSKYSDLSLILKNILNSQTINENQLFMSLKDMWIENGKYIQKIYGVTTNDKNIVIVDNSSLLNKDTIELFLDKRKRKEIKEILLFVGSWNFAGKDILEKENLQDWLLPVKNTNTPDIYIIGFQEIVNLNAKNVVFSISNSSKVESWKKALTKNLSMIDKYELLKVLDLVGIMLIIFVKRDLKGKIRNLFTSINKTGFMKTLGNKGNVIVRFEFDDTSFAVACCHLSASIAKNENRTKEMIGILDKNIQFNQNEKMPFKSHDVMIIFGDLNYRLEIDNTLCRQMIKNGNLSQLTMYDQLLKEKMRNSHFYDLEEGTLNFNPTYRYDINSNNYDTSKKKRTPAWCDRILWKRNDIIKQILYDRADYKLSDHRPIYAFFKINVNRNPFKQLNHFHRNIDLEYYEEQSSIIDDTLEKKIKKSQSSYFGVSRTARKNEGYFKEEAFYNSVNSNNNYESINEDFLTLTNCSSNVNILSGHTRNTVKFDSEYKKNVKLSLEEKVLNKEILSERRQINHNSSLSTFNECFTGPNFLSFRRSERKELPKQLSFCSKNDYENVVKGVKPDNNNKKSFNIKK